MSNVHIKWSRFFVCIRVASWPVPPAPREQDREERSGPKRTGVKVGRPWPKVGPNRSQLGPNLVLTCADSGQLARTGPNLSPAWFQHVWTQVGLNMRNLVLCGGIWHRSWAQDRNMAAREPPSNPVNAKKRWKRLELAAKKSFQCVALSPQNWPGVGRAWARAAPKRAELGPSCA